MISGQFDTINLLPKRPFLGLAQQLPPAPTTAEPSLSPAAVSNSHPQVLQTLQPINSTQSFPHMALPKPPTQNFAKEMGGTQIWALKHLKLPLISAYFVSSFLNRPLISAKSFFQHSNHIPPVLPWVPRAFISLDLRLTSASFHTLPATHKLMFMYSKPFLSQIIPLIILRAWIHPSFPSFSKAPALKSLFSNRDQLIHVLCPSNGILAACPVSEHHPGQAKCPRACSGYVEMEIKKRLLLSAPSERYQDLLRCFWYNQSSLKKRFGKSSQNPRMIEVGMSMSGHRHFLEWRNTRCKFSSGVIGILWDQLILKIDKIRNSGAQ